MGILQARGTLGWTERHLSVAVLVVLIVVGTLGATRGAVPAAIVAAAAIAAVALVALAFDAWAGIVLGIVAAAGFVFLREQLGMWTVKDFGTGATTVVSVLLIGWAAGWTGSALRVPRRARPEATGQPPRAAFGSLGMLDSEAGVLRLEEEIARAVTYQRPLSLIAIQVEADEAGGAGSHQLQRAAARAMENLLRDVDVPYALARNRFVAILPETNRAAATVALGRIFDEALGASYVDPSGTRVSMAEAAGLYGSATTITGPVAADDILASLVNGLGRHRDLAAP